MTTKKLLVRFDPSKPDQQSSDFLVIVMEGSKPKLLGVKSKMLTESGLVVYLGRDVTAHDLFAKLVETGRKIESVEQTLHTLATYIQQLQEFRIGNHLTAIEGPAEIGGFKLVKLTDTPSP